MATPNWKQFERLVAAIHSVESSGADVKWNDIIEGRQFDVTIRFRYGLHHYLTVIECKNYSNKVPVEKVDAFVTKSRDAKANKAIMVSSQGYQSGCEKVAQLHGIRLLLLNESIHIDPTALFREVVPALNIHNVEFDRAEDGGIYKFDETGGRLAYLMDKGVLTVLGEKRSPQQILDEWQLTKTNLDLVDAKVSTILFEHKAILAVPYEDDQEVVSFRFNCQLVNAFVATGPLLDKHIQEADSLRYELRDIEGNLEYIAKLRDIPFGYDGSPVSGNFYFHPATNGYYFCCDVLHDSVSWLLVESYQHGMLLQVKFTQELKYASYYTEVIDKKILTRLQKMLREYMSRQSS